MLWPTYPVLAPCPFKAVVTLTAVTAGAATANVPKVKLPKVLPVAFELLIPFPLTVPASEEYDPLPFEAVLLAIAFSEPRDDCCNKLTVPVV